MANEVTVSASLTFAKGNIPSKVLGISSSLFDVAGKNFVQASQNIGTAAEAIGLGDLGSIGFFLIKNNDSTNYVELYNSTGGTAVLKINPRMVAMGYFAGAVTAPALKANTSACDVEYLIVEI